MSRKRTDGFTLLELMITIAIIVVLAATISVNYAISLRKSAEALTKGNMGAIRSALSIYFSDNDGIYPSDNLASITNNNRYLIAIPITRLQPYHPDETTVTTEITPSETGGWSYNNVTGDLSWGTVRVGCLHQDSRSQTWSSY